MCSAFLLYSNEPVCVYSAFLYIEETQLNVTVTVYYTQYHASNMEMGSNQILFETFTLIAMVQVPALYDFSKVV